MEYFLETILEDRVKLHPSQLSKYYKLNIKEVLQTKYENICSRFGFIRNDSIEIIQVVQGNVEIHSFHGFVMFDVKFRAMVCNPMIGSVLFAEVINMNSFGILCASGFTDKNKTHNVIDIIIPREMQDNSTRNTGNIRIGDRLSVEIVGKKYQINNPRISTIGKLVEALPSTTNINLANESEDSNEMPNDELEEEEEMVVPDTLNEESGDELDSDRDSFNGKDDDDDLGEDDNSKYDEGSDMEDF